MGNSLCYVFLLSVPYFTFKKKKNATEKETEKLVLLQTVMLNNCFVSADDFFFKGELYCQFTTVKTCDLYVISIPIILCILGANLQ